MARRRSNMMTAMTARTKITVPIPMYTVSPSQRFEAAYSLPPALVG